MTSVNLFPNTTCLKDKADKPPQGEEQHRLHRTRDNPIPDNHFKGLADADVAVAVAEEGLAPITLRRARKASWPYP